MTSVPSDLDLGALLAEQDFVRRLVRSLVHHGADADDVAQQTWVAALHQPWRRRGSARGFLGQVARHVASNFRRGEARRRRREAEMAAEHAAPAVADALARESLRQQVVGELAALPEPYRSTLVLRFFEDLPPHAIAERAGAPAATVRARLMRGLDMLRERLDRRYGGDRAAWSTALLPLAREGGRAGTAAVAATAGLFGLKHLLFAGGAGVLLAAVLLWPREDAAPLTDVTGAASPPSLLTATARDLAAPAPAPARVPVASAPAPEPAADAAPRNGLHGRLVLPDGQPASNRKVDLIGLDPTRMFDGDPSDLAASAPVLAAATRSDGDGRFALADLRPRALLVLQAGRGETHSACIPVPHTPGSEQTTDLGDIVLTARGEVRGRIADEDGHPIAGAEVWAADVPGLVTLAVNIDRFAPEHGGILLLPRQQPDEDVAAFLKRTRRFLGSSLFARVVAPGAEFDAFVLDTPEWLARLWHALPMARTTSGADGAFVLHDVEPGANLLVARKHGFDGAVKPGVKVTTGAPRDVGELTLRHGETCSGVVLDAAGRPVAGAAVRVAMLPAAGFRGVAFCDGEVRTGGDGRFDVTGLRGGRVLVAARAREGQPWLVRGPLDVSAAVTVQFAPPAELTVRVPNAPAPRLRLTFGPSLGELARMGLRREVPLEGRTHTEPAGIRIHDLVPGSYELEVTAPGHVPTRRAVEVPGTVDVALEPAVPPFDVVVVASAGAPVAGARVRSTDDEVAARSVMPTSYGLPESDVLPTSLGCTGADGRLRVAGLPRGLLTLWADHPAHGLAAVRADLPADAVVLRLPAAATIAGTLLDAGQPARASSWRVTATPAERKDGVPRPYALAAPAADGSFRITGLEPGPHTVRVVPALPARLSLEALRALIADRIFSFFGDQGVIHAREVVLRAGETRTVEIDVARPPRQAPARAQVSGRVLVDGAPAPGVQVCASIGFFVRTDVLATTGTDGTYTVLGLQEGTQELAFVGACGTVLGKTAVAVPDHGAVTLDFEVRTGSLAGRALVPKDRTLEGAEVSGQGPEGATFTVPVAADGTFAAEQLASGDWTVSVRGHTILGPVPVRIALAPGQRVTGLELPAEAAFTLEVSLDGRAGERTFIELHHPASNSTWNYATGQDGSAHFRSLLAGKYRLSTEEPARSGEIELGGDRVRRRVQLTTAGVVPLD